MAKRVSAFPTIRRDLSPAICSQNIRRYECGSTASHQSSRPVGFSLGSAARQLLVRHPTMAIRHPRGNAGTEETVRSRRTATRSRSHGLRWTGERSMLSPARPCVSHSRFSRRTDRVCRHATRGILRARHAPAERSPFGVRGTGDCLPQSLPAASWSVAPAAQRPHLRPPSLHGSRNCTLQKEPLREERLQHRGLRRNLELQPGCVETVRIGSILWKGVDNMAGNSKGALQSAF